MNDEPIDDQPAADAEPAAERVTLALCAAVATIAQATGYWDDVQVTRPSPAEPRPVKHAAIEVQLDSELREIDGVGYGIEQIRATHLLVCDVVSPESKRTVSIDTLINRIKADVKRAVLKDEALARLVVDTVFGDAELQAVDEASHTGRILMSVDCIYRTPEDDPYVLLNEPQ